MKTDWDDQALNVSAGYTSFGRVHVMKLAHKDRSK